MIIVIRIGPTAPGLRPMASTEAANPRPWPSEPKAAARPMAMAGAKSPHEAYYFYYGKQLQAVRRGKWKLIVETPRPNRPEETRHLYDLDSDPGEKTNVAATYPEVVYMMEEILLNQNSIFPV